MKRVVLVMAFLFGCFLGMGYTYAVELRINFAQINLPTEAIIKDDRTLIPMRIIAEIFGARVDWYEGGCIRVYYNDTEIILHINSNKVTVNGENFFIDTAPIIKDSYTMVPLKFFSEYLGVELAWYGDTQMVNMVVEDEEIVRRAEQVSRGYERKSIYEGRIIVIDPGHGGEQTGAYYGGTSEKEINLAIAKYVKSILEKYDIKVYITRSGDKTTSLSYRTDLASAVNADLFISIHSNATVGSRSVSGTETLYKNNTLQKEGVTNRILADMLQEAVTSSILTYDRGLINRTDLYVLNHAKMPAALVEVGYMTNMEELKNLKDDSFRQKAAQGIADGILKTLDIMVSQ